jgi:hypothetical protein
VQFGIPCLFAPNYWPEGSTDVTDIVKAFYEKTPFPNYDGLDDRNSLRRKAQEGHFARLGRRVRVLDNFIVGRRSNLQQHQGNPRLDVIEADIADMGK